MSRSSVLSVSLVAAALAFPSAASTLKVGPKAQYKTPSAAARVAKDGDTVVIAAGEYKGDVCAWRANNLKIRGAGIDKTVLDAGGNICMGKGLWVICGANATIEGITFKNAKCKDRNGAGVRYDCNGDVTFRNCSFVGNENGILSGALDQCTMKVEKCKFYGNGCGDGYSHNIYVGAVKKLVFKDSVSDHARRGHNLKSRAHETEIVNSVFDDGKDGESSYLVNCPNGGKVTMKGCRLVQAPTAANGVMVSIGEEGAYPETDFVNTNNKFVNHRHAGTEVVLRK